MKKFLIHISVILLFGCNGRTDRVTIDEIGVGKISGIQSFVKDDDGIYLSCNGKTYSCIINIQSATTIHIWADRNDFPFSKFQIYNGDVFLGTGEIEPVEMMNKTSLDRVDIPVTIISSKNFLINVKDKVENNIKNPIEYFLSMYKSGVICWKDSDPTENIGFHSSDNAAHKEERKNDPDAKGENDNKFKSNNNTIKTKNTYTESRKF